MEEFKLPQYWKVKCDESQDSVLTDYINSLGVSRKKYYKGIGHNNCVYWSNKELIGDKHYSYNEFETPGITEITYEQFEEYVLGISNKEDSDLTEIYKKLLG